MIRDLVLREIKKYGGEADLVERLLFYGSKPYMTWLVHKLCTLDDGTPIIKTLEAFSELTETPFDKVRYAYFKYYPRTLYNLERNPEFSFVLDVLLTLLPSAEFWVDLLPFAYDDLKKVVAEQLFIDGATPERVCAELRMQKSWAYAIRKDYLARFIQQKGDCNDTEHNG